MLKFEDPEIDIFVTAIKFIWKKLVFVVLYSFGVYEFIRYMDITLPLPFVALSTIGTALAMLTAFRFRLAYDKWMDAHAIWQLIQSKLRHIVRGLGTFVKPNGMTAQIPYEDRLNETLTMLIAFPFSLHYALIYRKNYFELGAIGEKELVHLKTFFPEKYHEKLNQSSYLPLCVLNILSENIYALKQSKLLMNDEMSQIYGFFTQLEETVGVCERMKATSLPKRYRYLFDFLNYFFTLGIPWCLAEIVGLWSVFFTLLNSMLFSTLEEIGRRTEIPFGNRRQDIRTLHYAENCKKYISGYIKRS